MGGGSGCRALLVSGDAGRRRRLAGALGASCQVLYADDLSEAADELALAVPLVVVIDAALPRDVVTSLLLAVGDADRALLWVPELQLDLLDYGALVQIPYAAADSVLGASVTRLFERQLARAEIGRQKERLGRFDRVVEVVRQVRAEINSPLTAIIAEAELLLESDSLDPEQRRSLETVEKMARRIRELVARLNELGGND